MTKCELCDKPIYEGKICGDCEKWLVNRYDPTRGSPQSYDGGTLLAGDVAAELNITKHDAALIIRRYGFMTKTYSGIGRREFRFLRMTGEIADFLSRMQSKRKKSADQNKGE